MKPFIFLLASYLFHLYSCTKNTSVTGINLGSIQPVNSNVSEPVLWKTLPASWDENWFSSPAVFDLDNDGSIEIAFTTYSIEKNISNLIILNSRGKLLHRIKLFGRGSMAAPCLADIDEDNILELIISLKDTVGNGLGGVQIWKIPSARKNIMDWATGRGNYLRTGVSLNK